MLRLGHAHLIASLSNSCGCSFLRWTQFCVVRLGPAARSDHGLAGEVVHLTGGEPDRYATRLDSIMQVEG